MPASVRVRTPAVTRAVGLLSMPCALAVQIRVWMSRRPPGQVLMLGSSCAPVPWDLVWRCSISRSLASMKAAVSRRVLSLFRSWAVRLALPCRWRASRKAVSPVMSFWVLWRISSMLPLLMAGLRRASQRVWINWAVCCCRPSENGAEEIIAKSQSEWG